MKLNLRQQLTQFTHILQDELFPVVEERIGPLDEKARQLVATLEMVPLQRFVPSSGGWMGRPPKDRIALASAFVAKAVYGFDLTRQLLERLQHDEQLRLICGWKTARQVPHESTFSRAFAEFSEMELPQFVHEALIADTQKGRLVCHIARDSTAIETRERFPESEEKPAKQNPAEGTKRGKRRGPKGPPKKHLGGKPPKPVREDTRLHRQRTMELDAMLADLPQHCNIGAKKSNHGHQKYWRGYKLHLDVADGQIPISGILTAASVHDSQVAIPLATMTSKRVIYLYDLMDAAYDAGEIEASSKEMGHVPIISPAKRLHKEPFGEPEMIAREMTWAEEDRFRERTMVERVFARLKDEFGGREIRVRGAKKVMAHLMFGVLALTADQLLKLAR